jgi:hypothetical protein
VHDHIVAVVIIAAVAGGVACCIVPIMGRRGWGRRQIANGDLRAIAMNRTDTAISVTDAMNPRGAVKARDTINRDGAVRLDHVAAAEIRRVIAVTVKAATRGICLCGG